MIDTVHTFFSSPLVSHLSAPRLTYYEVCLASENRVIAGQHTGEMADLREALAAIFEWSEPSRQKRGESGGS